MKTPGRIPSYPIASLALLVAAALAWALVAHGAPAGPGSPPPGSAGSANALLVCTGPDSELRLPAGRGCATGAVALALEQADTRSLNCLDCDPGTSDRKSVV
jgi:hypothetical protein